MTNKTTEQKIADIKYRRQQAKMRKPEHTTSHAGIYPCPRCSSKDTGSDTGATSATYIDFLCNACGHKFRKLAVKVAPASKDMQERMGRLRKILAEEK